MANKSVGLLTIAFGADLRGFDKAMKKAQKSVKKFGASMQRTGENLTRNITLPVLGLGIAAIKMASDYEESLNKVRVSFGTTSHAVESFAKTTLTNFGIAEGSALEMASLFGDMGTSMGLTEKEAAKMSISMVGLAGDLSSFKNISNEIATTALASVFTGETESLKKLGIVMTEANLKQFALENGISQSIKTMSQAQKVQLRYNFVMSKSANALGDYLKTSDGVANSTRKLQESIKQLAEKFGTLLIPEAKKIIAELQRLVDVFANMSKEQKENLIFWAKFVAIVGPSLILIGKLSLGLVAVSKAVMGLSKAFGILRLAMLSNPITAIILGLATGVALLVANLGTMDIATKKSKKLYDDLIDTKKELKKLNDDELKSLKARTLIELETLGAELKIAKQKADDAAKKVNVGGAMLLGPDLGDSGNGQNATKFQLQETSEALTEVQNKYNKQFDVLKLINKTLKEGDNILEDQNNNVTELGSNYERSSDIMLDSIMDFAEKSKKMFNEGGFLQGPINGFKELTKEQIIAAKSSEMFESVLSSSLTSAAYSSEGFFKSFMKNIIQAVKQLLIQLAVITAIKFLIGGPGVAGDLAKAFSLAKGDILGLASGGLVTGPTMALVGEGAGTTASNPEVVAPLDKLKNYMNGGGSQQVEVYGRLSGNDIFISNQRGSINRQRSV
jgi:hypothetical protein